MFLKYKLIKKHLFCLIIPTSYYIIVFCMHVVLHNFGPIHCLLKLQDLVSTCMTYIGAYLVHNFVYRSTYPTASFTMIEEYFFRFILNHNIILQSVNFH